MVSNTFVLHQLNLLFGSLDLLDGFCKHTLQLLKLRLEPDLVCLSLPDFVFIPCNLLLVLEGLVLAPIAMHNIVMLLSFELCNQNINLFNNGVKVALDCGLELLCKSRNTIGLRLDSNLLQLVIHSALAAGCDLGGYLEESLLHARLDGL